MTAPVCAQVSITTDGSAPDNSAMLDVNSTSKGFLPPRMTSAQMFAISLPADGLTVYNTTLKSLCTYDGTNWIRNNADGASCGSMIYGGQTYATVIIGFQCWMKQNLNIGTAILASQDQSNNGVIEKYCYDNNTAKCDVYGGLYQWAEMVQYLNGATNTTSWSPVPAGNVVGICPAGWHLPADADWITLLNYLGGEIGAACALKEPGYTQWISPNMCAANTSGFTAFAGGIRWPGGAFGYQTSSGYFCSASEYSPANGYYRLLLYNDVTAFRYNHIKVNGISVRCLRD
jgi:uncharacterized protein (TIGR02145 family)